MSQRDKTGSGVKKKSSARSAVKKTPMKKPKIKAVAKTKPALAVPPEQRHRMISEAAFYISKRHGSSNTDPLRDWVEAETEINLMMNKSP